MAPLSELPLPFWLLTSFACLLLVCQCRVGSLSVERSTYIVHMDKSVMPKPFTSHHHWYSSTVNSLRSVGQAALDGSRLSPRLLYSYDNTLHGFSAVLSVDELEALKKSRGFVSAYSDKVVTLHTTHTTDFLSLNPASGLWPVSGYGEDAIVGVVDTGVWPESKSFRDEGMGKVPSRWKGVCEVGEQFNSSLCNSKLIGVRYFNKGVIANNPGIKITMNSARDTDGHGTHTASTVAGNFVDGVSFFGYGKGTARGVAPKARLAVYKVVWDEGCYTSDVIAGIDHAVGDGVDVISISLGFSTSAFYENPIAIASFGAMKKGVLVCSSAGNNGPLLGSLDNGVPWSLTVAAGTVDRSFAGTVTLGNGITITGWTMFPANGLVYNMPLYYNKTLALCDDPNQLASSPYAVIICENRGRASVLKQLRHVARSNSAGAIMVSDDPFLFELGMVPWPAVVISPKEAPALIKYAKTAESPTATLKFQQTILGKKPSPAVAVYSSRGPSASSPGILKPDLMAPGSLVLAAYIPNGFAAKIGGNIDLASEYTMMSGTSMACPHAAGVAALLKVSHPEWSPAAIKSAMMTTANPFDNTRNPIRDNGRNHSFASPLAMGSGHIDPNRALNPGLVYDTDPQDYVNLLCTMNYTHKQLLTVTRSKRYNCTNPSPDVNSPSFIVLYTSESLEKTVIRRFERIVTNVGDHRRSYRAEVTTPTGSRVTVSPEILRFRKKNEKQRYTLTISCKGDQSAKVIFGSIVWVEINGTLEVRSPIVVSPFPIED